MSETSQGQQSRTEVTGTDGNGQEQSGQSSRGLTGTLVIAFLAFLLGAAALGLATWIWLEREEEVSDQPEMASAEEVETLRSRMAESRQALEALAGRVDQVEQELDSIDIDSAGWRRDMQMLSEGVDERLDRRLGDMDSRLADAMDRIQEATGQQREVDRDIARRLVLIETASLLEMGQQRAELTADFGGARAAFRRASRQLRQADDPRFNRAAGLIARELEALEGVEPPAWNEIAARLSRLAEEVTDWPLDHAGLNGLDRASVEAEEDSGWWARVGRSLGGLVEVRPRDTVPVTMEQVEAVREQVRLRLFAAEMAAARQDDVALRHQLAQLQSLVPDWFDIDAAPVRRGLEQFESLQVIEPAEVPALGEALAEIKRLLDAS